ncbi:uncharacterized protein LOC123322157 isoform X2 [Coccinella septempunctata]|uniref:uncharacterized protein LOC123322157 isoform X2 n=1 Tax=Coccinella septempunctata TaxID=41139 RepID=UPI001D07671F|nr:uncharacterized protein LOC123322157 isoform X2 [Coccinella septempunctata]
MENGVLMQSNSVNMGATSNSNSARLAALQERKKSIEESLSKKEKELRELCLQEADLTGIIPSEMPLQPGESPPSIRRKVGTSYMLPENLLKYTNNKGESIADLELQLQLHANMAEAALGLAHKQNLSKTVRRQHKSEYQHHKREYKVLQEKIALLKEAQLVQQQQEQSCINDQQKQKKKPRPADQDGISVISNDPFRKSEHRQSIRSMRHTLQTDNITDLYPHLHQRMPTRSTEVPYDMGQQIRYEDLSSSFYKLNLTGFKTYIERRENYAPVQPPYNPKSTNYQHVHGSPTYPPTQFQYNHSTYNHQVQGSPVLSHGPVTPHNPTISPHSHHVPQNSPSSSDVSTIYSSKYNNPRYYQTMVNPAHYQNYTKYTNSNPIPISRQSSPNLNSNLNKYQYSNSPLPPQQSYMYKNSSVDSVPSNLQNPHQLQPHQQYEQNAGLGGCWKKKDSGEIIWCNSSSSIDPNWQRDKRFGSLDRRKNRRIQKRISPNGDNKSATLSTISYSLDQKKPTFLHSPQVQARHSQDRQLVRTQSLGSVGVQTLDSVWPSDDNSSCDSENRSIDEKSCNTIRRQKQREWRETSLDSPGSPASSIVSRCQSTVPPVLAPEEKYVTNNCIPPPIMTKPSLEIPAESNPSPRIPEANMELFNNNIHNIPKNCTIVQAGHCKPYHEETKPFEMSDFYKYSTKFKKSPSKSVSMEDRVTLDRSSHFPRNLRDHYDTKNVYHHHNHQADCSPRGSVSSGQMDHMSNTLEYSQSPSSQDNYSQDKNLWYSSQSQGEQENNNATLV